MDKIIPFFEIDGKRYEIKRTRYLLAEYDKLGEQTNLSNEDKANAVKTQNIISDIRRYAEKEQELWDKFCETADDEDERKYLKFKELREQATRQYAEFNDSAIKLQKAGLDILEKIVIKGIAEQYNMSEEQANEIWCSYVDEVGKNRAAEWLGYMSENLFGNNDEEEDNSFLSQMRKRAEQKATRRNKR